MEALIQITKLNDFVFCPYSIYFHSIYENFHQAVYHQSAQNMGKLKHENIDCGQYSSSARYLQGISVASEKYGLTGKIDIYDKKDCVLIERKNKVAKIYDGYKYQLYAQMFCLQEMNLLVKKLIVHSLSDNKRHEIPLPNKSEIAKFEDVVEQVKRFSIDSIIKNFSKAKCKKCIYKELCH